MGREAKILLSIGAVIIVGVSALIFASASKEQSQPKSDGTQLVKSDSRQTNPGAKVTLVEFGDLECPACAQAAPIITSVKNQYGQQLNFVFRHLPLQQHKNARPAAEAVEAAGAQGKFFEMLDLLYAKQDEWKSDPNPIPKFVTYAQSLGLDGDKLKQSVEQKQFAKVIQRDYEDAMALNLNSTPSLFVNGQPVKDFTQLPQAVQAAMAAPQQ